MCARAPIFLAALFPCLLCAQPQIQFAGPPDTQTVRIVPQPNGNTLFVGTSAIRHSGIYLWSVGSAVSFGSGSEPSGTGSTVPLDATIDSNGNIWIVGTTTSDDFPLKNPIVSQNATLATTGFVMELGPGGDLKFSTYLGGQSGNCGQLCPTSASVIVADSSGNVYIGGGTADPSFPVTQGAYLSSGPGFYSSGQVTYSFVTRISPSGQIVYSTLIGTGEQSCRGGSSCLGNYGTSAFVTSMAVDAAGNVTAAESMSVGPGRISRLAPDGSRLLWSVDTGMAGGGIPSLSLTQDSAGNISVLGSYAPLNEADLPQFGTGTPNLFAEKLNSSGANLYTVTLGGASADAHPAGILVDASGNAWLSGTDSSNSGALSGAATAGADFLVELSSSGTVAGAPLRFPRGVIAAAPLFDPGQQLLIPGNNALLTLPLNFSPATPLIVGFANAASLTMNSGIYPGALLSLFGFGLPAGSPSVTINGIPAPILYASPNQINLQVPFEFIPSFFQIAIPSVNLTITPPVERSLGIFTTDGNHAAALNQDGTVNSASNPATQGSIVTLYGTGAIWPAGLSNGGIATAAAPLNQEMNGFQIVDAHGIPEFIFYAGAAPELIDGVFQINVAIPTGARPPFTLQSITDLGQSIVSNSFTIYLQ
jgi:uncharacterized protein (TIGR03437 family)